MRSRPSRRFALWALAIVSASLPQVGARAQDQSVHVSVKLNTWYDDSERNRRTLAEFVDFFPPEADAVSPGETVNLFIIRRYHFGPSALPKTYSLLKTAICRLNNIDSDTIPIRTATIFAPPLPRRARPNPNPKNPYNALPRIATFRSSGFANTLIVAQQRQTEDDFRRGSRTTIVNADLPRAVVEAKRGSRLFSSPSLHASTAGVRLLMEPAACGAGVGAASFPDASTKTAVTAVLNTPPIRHAYLFILDSGWPNAPSYSASVQRLETVLGQLRAIYHLKPYSRRQPMAYRALDPTTDSMHVIGVASAISPITQLDSAERVRIIFLPLSPVQGELDLYRNLLETYYAYTWTTSLNALTPAGKKLPEPVLQEEAAAAADATLQRMSQFASGGDIYTDNSILEAAYMVGDALATNEHTSYVLNESWTVGGGLLKFSAPSKPAGITVVAAGNDGRDFVATATDFAQQAVVSDYYLAVMNIDPSGNTQCTSSVIDPTRAGDVRVVGFDGNLPTDSGTSYAAPRVAWFLALHETTAKPPSAFWATDTIKQITDVRAAMQPPWKSIWFDSSKYLGQH